MYNSQTTDTVLQSSQLLRSWLLGNQMKDKANTSVIIAGRPEEAQATTLAMVAGNQKMHKATTSAMVAGQPEEAQSYHIGHGR